MPSEQRLLNTGHAARPGILLTQCFRQSGNPLLCLLASSVCALRHHEPGLTLVACLEEAHVSHPRMATDEVSRSLAGASSEQLQSVFAGRPLTIPVGAMGATG